jgi:hypothetical protein
MADEKKRYEVRRHDDGNLLWKVDAEDPQNAVDMALQSQHVPVGTTHVTVFEHVGTYRLKPPVTISPTWEAN